jgi:hypothetical protein
MWDKVKQLKKQVEQTAVQRVLDREQSDNIGRVGQKTQIWKKNPCLDMREFVNVHAPS